jgi:hypothetical protein
MNSRRFMSDPKVWKRDLSGSNEKIDRGQKPASNTLPQYTNKPSRAKLHHCPLWSLAVVARSSLDVHSCPPNEYSHCGCGRTHKPNDVFSRPFCVAFPHSRSGSTDPGPASCPSTVARFPRCPGPRGRAAHPGCPQCAVHFVGLLVDRNDHKYRDRDDSDPRRSHDSCPPQRIS